MTKKKRTKQNSSNRQSGAPQAQRVVRTGEAKRMPADPAEGDRRQAVSSTGKRTASRRTRPKRRRGIIWTLLKIFIPAALLIWLIYSLAGHFSSPKEEQVWEMTQQATATFSDGQTVDCWRMHQGSLSGDASYYKLSDGTVLLIENDPELQLEEEPAFAALSDASRKAISDYYAARGKLYDLPSLLQQAYNLYQASPESFTPAQVQQMVSLSASNERILCCLTSVVQTVDSNQSQLLRCGEVFRCETGERVELFSMFNVSETQARASLVRAADPALQSALAELLQPEWVIFCPENIEINVPAGTFSLQENVYQLGIRYEDLAGQLYTWAIPDSPQ